MMRIVTDHFATATEDSFDDDIPAEDLSKSGHAVTRHIIQQISSNVVKLTVVATWWVLVGIYCYHYGPQYFKKSSKQSRRELSRSKRRKRKNERREAKKAARSQVLAIQRAGMTEDEKNEQRERIRMQRVEQYQKLECAQRNGVRVVVDLAFAAAQTTRERHSIFKQLGCVYGYMKNCPLDKLVSLQLASCTHELEAMCTQHGVLSWKIGRYKESLQQLYNAHVLVYLSPDSENVLTQLDPANVYVVGGIVDRSVRKGETEVKAQRCGIRTARLPLQEHFQQCGTRVRTHILNVDSVIIALNEVANHGDWGRAFERAVPLRIARRKGQRTEQIDMSKTYREVHD